MTHSLKNLFVQFILFLSVSGLGWLIDFTIYLTLTYIFHLSILLANYISSLVAITFVFSVSTKKIFQNNTAVFKLKTKYVIYVVYQLILIYLVSTFGQFLYNYSINNYAFNAKIITIIIKVIITPITMVVNFIAMKLLTKI